MRPVLLSLLLLTACRSVEDEVTVFFPSQASLDATSVLAFTAFEPIVVTPESEVPEFVGCDRIGVFPPIRTLDPENIATFPNLGEVFRDRETQPFPFDGGWNVAIPEVDGDNPNNPWGAVLVYIEAQGEVRVPEDGGQITATLLSGCYCVRTLEGGHPDSRLDQEVKTACPLLGGADGTEKTRTIELGAVVTPEFNLEACTVQDLTSPKNQRLSPGPAVCVDTVRCDDAPLATDCFECQQPCDELSDRRNVPVTFTIDQPGGDSEPKSQIVLTNAEGVARGSLTVDDCETAIGVHAQIVGRTDEPVRFDVQCVEPVSRFNCGNEKRLVAGLEPLRMALLPGEDGPDHVAILYDDGQSAMLSVMNPTVPGTEQRILVTYPNETPRVVHGFYYDLENRTRPVLAVATSANDELRLYIYDWDGENLVPHDNGTGLIAEDCASWFCGSLASCGTSPCSGQSETCGSTFDLCMDAPVQCHLKVEFQTEVSMSHADVDGDGRADLAVATNSDVPITTYFSGKNAGPGIYSPQGCACSQFAQAPAAFELIDFGGSAESSIDLVIGAAGGAYLRYSQALAAGGSVISCGQACRFGDLVPVRDVAKGHFQCNPANGLCPHFDAVIVSANTITGGSFDDPGTIRVVYGTSNDLCLEQDLFSIAGSNVVLLPRKLEGAESSPTDPRTVEVGDFNADGHDDLAVLFGSSEEVHVWLGASNKGLGELEQGIRLSECELAASPEEKCTPLRDFALPDFDGDGRNDVAVVCKQGGDNRLRWYTPGTE